MTKGEMIKELQDLSRRFQGLMADPQPGLATWDAAVGRILTEIAKFAPEPRR